MNVIVIVPAKHSAIPGTAPGRTYTDSVELTRIVLRLLLKSSAWTVGGRQRKTTAAVMLSRRSIITPILTPLLSTEREEERERGEGNWICIWQPIDQYSYAIENGEKRKRKREASKYAYMHASV
jgi:hypothetical protein